MNKIKSERAKNILSERRASNDYIVELRQATEAILQAEYDARDRAVRAYALGGCRFSKEGLCMKDMSFVPCNSDCEEMRVFLNLYDNE